MNELEGRTDYTGKHGGGESAVGVIAKNLLDGENRIILLSPSLYLEIFDSMVRCFILFHEICHVINVNRFPKIPTDSVTRQNYLGNLYYFYDEYYSDRVAFKITDRLFQASTDVWKRFIDGMVEEYLTTATDVIYYDQIRNEIAKFRDHADVNRFLKEIHDSMSVVSITTIHAFARYHHIEEKAEDLEINESPFINHKTIALMDFFKQKYESGSVDLEDGLQLITDYMTNFGLKFEDRPKGGYVYVLDI